jgi:hypothetical protein
MWTRHAAPQEPLAGAEREGAPPCRGNASDLAFPTTDAALHAAMRRCGAVGELSCGGDSEGRQAREEVRRLPRLLRRLNCAVLPRGALSAQVNFLAHAAGVHEDLLPLYAFNALSSNPNSTAELVVEDAEDFVLKHHQAAEFLLARFGPSAVCVRKSIVVSGDAARRYPLLPT